MSKPAWAPHFEPHVQQLLDLYRCPGLALGIAIDGEPVYFNSFGYRDKERELPMTPETVAGLASITKSFTCVAIMQLQEAGKLSVFDPVIKYLPEFRTPNPAYTPAITLHHLMTHTAGLPPLPTLWHVMARSMKADPTYPHNVDQYKQVDTVDEMLALLAGLDYELLGPPGTRFSYSNDSYALLGAIIERVSGQSCEAYMQQHLFAPAGMTRTTFDTAKVAEMENVTVLYAPKPGGDGVPEIIPAPGWWETGPMAAGGALRSTVSDMLRYTEIYRNGGVVHGARILTEASVRAMTTPYVDRGDGLYYAYGLMVVPAYHGVSLIEHGGALKAISSQFTVVPGKGLTAVALTNLAGVPAADLALAAVNAALGLPVETKRVAHRPYSPTPAELKRCESAFTLTEGGGGELRFFVDGDVLKVKSEGALTPTPETALTPRSAYQFELKIKESTTAIRFHFDANGDLWAASFGLRMLQKAR